MNMGYVKYDMRKREVQGEKAKEREREREREDEGESEREAEGEGESERERGGGLEVRKRANIHVCFTSNEQTVALKFPYSRISVDELYV